ncbi:MULTISPECIES: ABC transporter permease [Clostridium]|uniref:ABC-2 type transport system permease protein n=1 Tax=Clostridium cadaveris TaxID=1529 RepID=A0A1I2MK41_9CLOT|nr:ABC transporter permease [Clostridium cadaveris]MDU4951905.1 ABC transporter permease [Clostridium sp.]NME64231.1 ABC transporter permease [Clostridium cadaveris]NWK11002.1 ABC transporter permease [Clostridium cadaveris]UFH65915.1 ABC transporter permease [Clostridium cadaveris]SFF91280.1 ABC-2 type transport system permease protein [Clostridium cadaveris]
MFFHNYKYRIKCIVKDKQMMFWTLLFPIILATLFNLAFSNLSSAENFSSINIAVVKDDEHEKNTEFIEVLKSVSNGENDKNLFNVEYTSKDMAQKLLDDNKVDGFIYFNDGIKVVVKKSGINQTILKSFVDEFKQTSSTIKTIIEKNPEIINQGTLNSLMKRSNYIKDVSISKVNPDTTVNYFYTLIAMTCFYGSFLGIKEVSAIQGNQSAQGARINTAPTNKLKVFMVSMAAATTVQLFDIGILIAYLALIIKVGFGNQLGYIILTCIIGTIAGVTFGTCIGAIIKKGEGLKIGILVGLTMIMSYFSGMMYDKMKYIVNNNMPILGYINPVNLIADSFYSLYYYDNLTKFFTNLSLLCGFSIIFSSITYLVLRRQKYASL